MVGIRDLYYSGTSGLELDLRGRMVVPAAAESARAPLDQIAGRMTDVASRYPGAWVEQKPLGLTLHYRAVASRWVPRLRCDAADAIDPWLKDLRIEEVTLGLEVIPDLGWDKGTAVREILADLDNGAFPIYAGDSANDAAALATVEDLNGISIGVGSAARGSDAWLPGSGVVGSLVILLANILHDVKDEFPLAR